MAGPSLTTVRVGTAGWSLPKALRVGQSAALSVLEQYAAQFDVVEINSSFYRPHRRSTYERWCASVPPSFRFSVKLPRLITHELGLSGCRAETFSFLENAGGLQEKLGVLLVQLPRSRTFDAAIAGEFFKALRQETPAHIVLEARSPSWFVEEATALLEALRITRVLADPAPSGCEFSPQAHARFAYWRLHGSPRIYYSPYPIAYLHRIAAAAHAARDTWCIFDNTAAGAAWFDAIALKGLEPA